MKKIAAAFTYAAWGLLFTAMLAGQVAEKAPAVPSEAQVAKDGIDLTSMQVKLLQKVEELTLHVIALEKRTRSLEEENAHLKNQP